MLPRTAAFSACVAFALASQNQPSHPSFRSGVNYVLVDAYPTLDNRPVTDLTRDEFQILENGAIQTIEHFEYVRIHPGVANESRRDPNTVHESGQATRNPRARVFVVFLDTNFVDLSGSFGIRRPILDALNRLIGPDDLYAVMTPEMAARDISFSRTTPLEKELTRNWDWGRFDNPKARNSRERDCEAWNRTVPELAEEAMNRRRERQTLDALADLVGYLRTVREERKAVITITQGWVLYGPNAAMGGLRDGCGRDVMWVDHKREFLRLVGQANRANASFYAIDPRGLAVFDQSITRPLSRGPGTPLPGFHSAAPPDLDSDNFRSRRASLRSLADGTDGLALFDSNDLSASFREVIEDLSSYYLLGYYSSTRPDGRYHQISVRVKRPGISVRARRGYLAADAALSTSSMPTASPLGEGAMVHGALGRLGAYNQPAALRVLTAGVWTDREPSTPVVWVTGELGAVSETKTVLADGAVADVEVTSGSEVAAGKVTIAPGTRTFSLRMPGPTAAAYPAEYTVRVTVRRHEEVVASETSLFEIPAPLQPVGARWFRRGASTQAPEIPTADLRFRRSECLRVEVPSERGDSVSARLLDRNGGALPVPLEAAVRTYGDGSHWLSAQAVLAPLGPGEYVIELSNGSRRTLSAFRLVP